MGEATYSYGDIVTVKEEWESSPRSILVLRENDGWLYTLDEDMVHSDTVISKVGHLSDDTMFARHQAYMLKDIPKEFHGPLSYKAYEDGHAYGNSEILSHLEDLVGMLAKPLAEYTARIIKENR